MYFKDLIGQKALGADLRAMVQRNRMPHAMLILGSTGSGTLPLALAWIRYLICEQVSEQDACGKCAHCRKMDKLIHPDVHFSFPVVGTNTHSDHFIHQWRDAVLENPYLTLHQFLQLIGAENKQGNINKEACLSISRKLHLKSFESTKRVLLMWRPEFLGNEGNRLLKLIEEPPPNTFFVLVAENPQLILNTILSRCQLVKTTPLKEEEVQEALKKRYPELKGGATMARLANGDFTEALRLATGIENDFAALYLDWLRKAYKGNGQEMVSWVNQFARLGRENQKQFFLYGLHFIRELLAAKVLDDSHARLNEKELKAASSLKELLELEQLEAIMRLIDQSSFGIERNANPKILMLDASIQLHQIIRRRQPEPSLGDD